MPQSTDSKTKLWAKRLRDFENSSLTVAQFCNSVGCSVPTFYQGRRKLADDTPATSAQSAFLQDQTKSDTARCLPSPHKQRSFSTRSQSICARVSTGSLGSSNPISIAMSAMVHPSKTTSIPRWLHEPEISLLFCAILRCNHLRFLRGAL
jgi:hypothetical protein